MYVAVVLDKNSRKKLIDTFQHLIGDNWTYYAHHMTINMGTIKHGPLARNEEYMLDDDAVLIVTHVGVGEKVVAVKVETDVPSVNKIKHVTVAVNRKAGGKPVMSNHIKKWLPLTNDFKLTGTIKEVKQ